MKCLEKMVGTLYQPELVKKLTDLYMFKGKDFYYEDVLKNYMNGIVEETIEKDTLYSSLLLNLNITDSRKKAIIKKDSEPKTKDEMVLSNLKKIFRIIQKKGTDLELTDNEFLSLANTIFDGSKKILYKSDVEIVKNNLLDERVRISKRDKMQEELKLYRNAINKNDLEPISVITAFYVDLINMKYFNDENDFISLVILYALLFSQRFNVFKHQSFFELYFKKLEAFKTLEIGASMNWESGFANTTMLNKGIIDLLLEGYNIIEKKVDDFTFDKKLKKIDNVEAAIMRLPAIFSRKDVKDACPRLSDSTINRALDDLKRQNKIRPNGTGRSATWMKIVDNEAFQVNGVQVSMWDILDND